MTNLTDVNIAVIGLGYVGLPLAVEFAKKFNTIGFDIRKKRVQEISDGIDSTLEVEDDKLKDVINNAKGQGGLFCTTDKRNLGECDFYVVTVPTPTDRHNKPILTPLIEASETVGSVLSKDDIVVYESTVYPGVTEDECVPVLENISGLEFNRDFYVGYSPERINPGDKEHTVTKIKKVTSGSTPEVAETIDALYGEIITAGTHKAPCIKVAEAAKVIENSQRDINIAFVNELSKIFNRLDIDTQDVLDAAGTKWNFLPFRPGLVGGHCIGVDPYYLAQKAEEVGYHPEIILAGRRLNDGMGAFAATEFVKKLIKIDISVTNSRVLVLGITFKANCPDIRNTRAIDIINELNTYDIDVDIYDPWASADEVEEEYGIELITQQEDIYSQKYDGIVLAVAHNEFLKLDYDKLRANNSIVYDVKSILPKELVDARL